MLYCLPFPMLIASTGSPPFLCESGTINITHSNLKGCITTFYTEVPVGIPLHRSACRFTPSCCYRHVPLIGLAQNSLNDRLDIPGREKSRSSPFSVPSQLQSSLPGQQILVWTEFFSTLRTGAIVNKQWPLSRFTTTIFLTFLPP